MKKILVPTDLSIQASYAFEVALSIARKTGSAVHLYHVIEVPDYPEINAITEYWKLGTTGLMEAIETRMRQLTESEATSGLSVDWSIDYDTPFEKITQKAHNEKFDLIVIGFCGRKILDRLAIGSTTDKVITHASCPVLTIKEKLSCFSPSKIVFASDFTRSIPCCVSTVKELVNDYNASLHLLRVSTKAHFENTRHATMLMKTFATANAITDYTINNYNDDSEEEGILHFAEDIQSDLLCIPLHGKTGIARLFSGSIAANISQQATLPVMTCKIPVP